MSRSAQLSSILGVGSCPHHGPSRRWGASCRLLHAPCLSGGSPAPCCDGPSSQVLAKVPPGSCGDAGGYNDQPGPSSPSFRLHSQHHSRWKEHRLRRPSYLPTSLRRTPGTEGCLQTPVLDPGLPCHGQCPWGPRESLFASKSRSSGCGERGLTAGAVLARFSSSCSGGSRPGLQAPSRACRAPGKTSEQGSQKAAEASGKGRGGGASHLQPRGELGTQTWPWAFLLLSTGASAEGWEGRAVRPGGARALGACADGRLRTWPL